MRAPSPRSPRAGLRRVPALRRLERAGRRRLRRILSDLGYRFVTAPYDERSSRERHVRFARRCGAGPLVIEIHWALSPPRHYARLPVKELERRLVPVRVEEEPAWTLEPEDHLFHACLQIDRFRAPLFRYVDAPLLIARTPSFDRDAFAGRVLRFGLRRTAGSLLHELALLYATPIPRAVRRALRSDTVLEEALRAPYRLRSDREMGSAWYQLVGLLMRDRPEGRIAFLRLPWAPEDERFRVGPDAKGPACSRALRIAAGMGILAAGQRLAGLAGGLGLASAPPVRGALDALWARASAPRVGPDQPAGQG